MRGTRSGSTNLTVSSPVSSNRLTCRAAHPSSSARIAEHGSVHGSSPRNLVLHRLFIAPLFLLDRGVGLHASRPHFSAHARAGDCRRTDRSMHASATAEQSTSKVLTSSSHFPIVNRGHWWHLKSHSPKAGREIFQRFVARRLRFVWCSSSA